jgi:hypothetical protein
MKAYRLWGYKFTVFDLALDGGKCSASRTSSFSSGGKSQLYPLHKRLRGPHSHLDDAEKRKFSFPL